MALFRKYAGFLMALLGLYLTLPDYMASMDMHIVAVGSQVLFAIAMILTFSMMCVEISREYRGK